MNKRTRILLYGSNVWYLGEGMLGPLFAVFAQKVGGSVLNISWAWATYLVVTGIMYIIVGKLSRGAKNQARIMIFGYALGAFLTFGYVFVSSPLELFIIQGGLGVAMALSTPTWHTLYSKYGDKSNHSYEWGLYGGQGNIFAGAAVFIGGFIVSYFSFTTLFVTMGAVQIIATVYQMRILKEIRR